MLVVRILKVSLIMTGVLIISLIILKAISIVKQQKKIPSLQDLIDRGIHPTVRNKVKERTENTKNDNNSF
jgi:hypothetical protein